MTDVLFHNARLIDPEAGSEALGWLLIKDGMIADRGFGAAPFTGGLDCLGHCLAPGMIDIGVKVGEPGERHKESYASAGQAAAAGGVTTMVIRPDTSPAIDTPEVLSYVNRRAREVSPVNVLPMAALTKGRAGQEMAEIGFLKDAGAVAFTDCDSASSTAKAYQRCLAYAAELGVLVMTHAQDPELSAGACATSGALATKMGLPSVSPLAERLEVERDLAFAEATGVRMHLDQITCAASLPALARARRSGVDVSVGISVHHLTLNELDISGYRTFYKVKPPLRAEEDRMAMVEALAAGEIDIISSMHTPQDEESKCLPFEEAASGAVALETLLPGILRLYHAGHISLSALWAKVSLNPAKRLGLQAGRLCLGAPADLVLFDPDASYRLDRAKLRSKSKNTPFDGQIMQGKVLGTWVCGRRVHEENSA